VLATAFDLIRGATTITAAITAKRTTARAAVGNSAVVWVEARTTTVPIIQLWYRQTISYVPGVVNV